MSRILDKIISGGQAGADRAGLDAAMEAGIPVGGFCPRKQRAEDGTIPARYPMVELETVEYAVRIERNVVESDGTLILNMGELSGGTLSTLEYARKHARPCLIVHLDNEHDTATVTRWIADQKIRVLNIAGPRESKCSSLSTKMPSSFSAQSLREDTRAETGGLRGTVPRHSASLTPGT